jgi:hypothetical protein
VQPDLLDFFDFNNVPWASACSGHSAPAGLRCI